MIAQTLGALFKEAMGLQPESIEKLSGARTNANYRVKAGGKLYAMRVPGEGTNEYINRHEEVQNLRKVAASFSFVPRVFFADGDTGLVISEFLTGARSLNSENASDVDVLAGTASTLAKVHGSGIEFGNTFDLVETKRSYEGLLMAAGFALPEEVVEAKPMLEAALSEYAVHCDSRLRSCHIDPNMANFMVRRGTYFLIDWEYSGMCNPLFDVANMVMTDRLNKRDEAVFVQEYEKAAGFEIDRREYMLTKIASDWMWLFWHLIKLSQGQMVEYNDFSWRNRLSRALANMREIGDMR